MVKALAAATVSAVVTSLVIYAVRAPSELSSGLIIFFFLYGIPIAGVAALTVGLPAHLLLSRFRVRIAWRSARGSDVLACGRASFSDESAAD